MGNQGSTESHHGNSARNGASRRKETGSGSTFLCGSSSAQGTGHRGTTRRPNLNPSSSKSKLVNLIFCLGTQDLSSFLNNDGSKKSGLITQTMLS